MTEESKFVTIPLKRGFTEIATLFHICQNHQTHICGGYARYCASPRFKSKLVRADDIDLFPQTTGTTDALLAELMAYGFSIKHENHVSITLGFKGNSEGKQYPEGPVRPGQPKATKEQKQIIAHWPTPQIIKPLVQGAMVTVGTIEEILNNFDFTIVRAAIISNKEALVDVEFEHDEAIGLLRLKNIHCPISSLLRCCKYSRKGYFLRPFEALKLFADWTDRPESYRIRISALFARSAEGEQSDKNPGGMTRKEIDELESLLRID